MANTEVSKGNGPGTSKPNDMFGAMRNEMDRIFQRFEQDWPRWPVALARTIGGNTFAPEVDYRDNGNQLTIEVDLPGIDEKDVSVTLANGTLTIKGERKAEREEKNESYYLAERSYGAFQRSLRLPESIDENKLEAKFDKGVLRIVAPKKPEAVKAEKKIEIGKH